MTSNERISQAFVDIADTLVADFDLVEFLQGLTVHAAEISGADAVGLLLADHHGTLQFMAASNDSGRLLELIQLQQGAGPCLDCYRSKRPVVNADLASAAEKWPAFVPPALEAGFTSVHAFPLRLRDDAIGAMGLFGKAATKITEDEVRVVQALADVATIALLQERSISRSEILAEQLQGALTSRIVIEQAKGALAQLEGTTPSEAFQLMRSQARSGNRRIAEVAADVLDGLPGTRPRPPA